MAGGSLRSRSISASRSAGSSVARRCAVASRAGTLTAPAGPAEQRIAPLAQEQRDDDQQRGTDRQQQSREQPAEQRFGHEAHSASRSTGTPIR
jgi:hypothetical protein